MINPQWLELPISRTNFHGPKAVRAIKVRLYRIFKMFWSFVMIETISEFLKIYERVTDEAELAETN